MSTSTGQTNATMPTEVSAELSWFDRFATAAALFASRAWFFSGCVLMVLVWAPSYFLFGDLDTWQLVINTSTTIVTFLMVALLQNSQSRSEAAMQQKLNAIAKALADFMDESSVDHPELREDSRELRAAIGLEERESA